MTALGDSNAPPPSTRQTVDFPHPDLYSHGRIAASKVLSNNQSLPVLKGEIVKLPLSPDQRAELARDELVRIAIDAFLRIEGRDELDPGAVAHEINLETGVGMGPARLVAFAKSA